jgi:hypothetical protein
VVLPFSRRSGARLFIGDTGALMNDVVWATRNGKLTSLLAALHHDAALLYIPRHVLIEIERDLPVYARRVRQPVDPDLAVSRWRTLYAPCIRVVDVPTSWGADDRNVQAVADRHPADVPTARLAFALFPSYVLAKDNDLTDNFFGKHDHLPLLLAAANEGEVNYVNQAATVPVVVGELLVEGAVRGFRRLPAIVQIGLVVACGFLAYQWHQDGRLAARRRQVFSVVTDLANMVAPLLQQMYQRMYDNEAVWAEHLPRPSSNAGLSEQIARVLAFAPDHGMLAGEVARQLDMAGSIKNRTVAVRDALNDCEAFTQVSRGRWRLGHPSSNLPRRLPPALTMEWLQRAHRSPSGPASSRRHTGESTFPPATPGVSNDHA